MTAFVEFFESLSGNAEVVRLLDASLGKILTDDLWTPSAVPAEARDAAGHICDWITIALRDGASWLSRTDDRGVPLKLAKCHSLEMLMHEADKAMRIALQRSPFAVPRGGQEEIVAYLAGGYTLVRLLTETSLNYEGGMMQHCIGLGAYDQALGDPDVKFLSLRDRAGKPHVTVEAVHGFVRQMKGKQNRSPLAAYIGIIAPGLRALGLRMHEDAYAPGTISSKDGEIYSVYDLPAGFAAHQHYHSGLKLLTRLPEGMTAAGALYFRGSSLTTVPDGLDAAAISLESCHELQAIGSGVRSRGNLYLGGCPSLSSLPADLHVQDHLYTVWRGDFGGPVIEPEYCDALVDIPPTLYVGGDIYLNGCRSLRSIPQGLVVRQSLNVEGTKIEKLPDPLTVPQNLLLGGGSLAALPRVLHVGGDLWIGLHEFGLLLSAIDNRHDIRIGGTVYVEGQAITINLMKHPEHDVRYIEKIEGESYYLYNPPADLPVPTDWTKMPPPRKG